jgi:hypothetical protein
MYAVTPNPACDGTDHGDPAPAFSQPTGPGAIMDKSGRRFVVRFELGQRVSY